MAIETAFLPMIHLHALEEDNRLLRLPRLLACRDRGIDGGQLWLDPERLHLAQQLEGALPQPTPARSGEIGGGVGRSRFG